jgi:hypothetical protein
MEMVSINQVLINSSVQLAVGIYFVAKLIDFITNIYRYKAGQQKNIGDIKPFLINYLTLIMFAASGAHILIILGTFIDNIQLVAISLLFIFRAFIDSTLSFYIDKYNSSV